MLGPEYSTIAPAIPGDHARQVSAEAVLAEALGALRQGLRVLDLGCGDGRGVDQLSRLVPGLSYSGVDIETSPEVASRTRSDAEFKTFDGIHLPWPDDSFDAVFTQQVYEHVRHPDALTAEVCRVLKPGGVFAGSMSGLEPYHSYSIFNFTPWGVWRVMSENGLEVTCLRPGVEGTSLLIRQITLRKIGGFRLAYPLLGLMARLKGWDAQRVNYLKLRFAGHICFAARKPE